MASEELENRLRELKAYRKSKLEVAGYVLSNPETFPKLLEYYFKTSKEISYKAAWTLEHVFAERPELLYAHLDAFFNNISRVKKEQALRPTAKICESMLISHYSNKKSTTKLELSETHKNRIAECCFDWLINPVKVATKAYAITTLCILGTEYRWIHPALKEIL